MNLIIANKKIKTKDGLFRLNDLHKAAVSQGENKRSKEPAKFLSLQSTESLINELTTHRERSLIISTIEGRNGGTFVCKELVYAYAMFCSAKFNLQVIQAYDTLVTGQLEELQRQQSRQSAKLEAKFLTDAIKYDKRGEAKHYHFSNEFNLINKVVLGMNAKQYRIENGLEPNQPIRDTLTKAEIAAIEHMQRLDTGMIELGYTYEQRKSELSRVFLMRHNKALCAEVKRLES